MTSFNHLYFQFFNYFFNSLPYLVINLSVYASLYENAKHSVQIQNSIIHSRLIPTAGIQNKGENGLCQMIFVTQQFSIGPVTHIWLQTRISEYELQFHVKWGRRYLFHMVRVKIK